MSFVWVESAIFPERSQGPPQKDVGAPFPPLPAVIDCFLDTIFPPYKMEDTTGLLEVGCGNGCRGEVPRTIGIEDDGNL